MTPDPRHVTRSETNMTRRFITISSGLLLAILLAGCGNDTPSESGEATEVAAAEAAHPGQAPYEAKCAACHDKARRRLLAQALSESQDRELRRLLLYEPAHREERRPDGVRPRPVE